MTSNEDAGDRTVVAGGDTMKLRMTEVEKAPPAIVLLSGPAEWVGKQWPLTQPELIIGRVPEVPIYVDDRSVSKNHAKLVISGNQVSLVDLASTNGTEVGNQKLEPNAPKVLANNDQIRVGNLIFKYLEKGSLESLSMQKTYDRTQIDAMTQIYNKGAYLLKAEELFKRAKLTETPLGMIVFDLDHFKKLNDSFGHQGGDYVLKELAALIQKSVIRQQDFFARYGGEEFVVILSGSNLKQAVEIGERVRSSIENHQFMFTGQRLPVTVSVGCAAVETQMQSAQELFEKADQASYVSKRGGRNRVSTI